MPGKQQSLCNCKIPRMDLLVNMYVNIKEDDIKEHGSAKFLSLSYLPTNRTVFQFPPPLNFTYQFLKLSMVGAYATILVTSAFTSLLRLLFFMLCKYMFMILIQGWHHMLGSYCNGEWPNNRISLITKFYFGKLSILFDSLLTRNASNVITTTSLVNSEQ